MNKPAPLALGDRVVYVYGDQLVRTTDGLWHDARKEWVPLRDAGRFLRPSDADRPVEGVVVGRRVLSDGRREWLGEDEGYAFHPERRHTAYLIAHHLDRLPVRVPADRIRRAVSL